MKAMFEKSKNITFTDTSVTILSSMKKADKEKLNQLAEELL